MAAGAVLAMSTDMDDFPDREYDWFDRRKCPRGNARAVIMIGKAEDVAITGLGTLDCRGSHVIERFTDEKGWVCYRRTEDRLPGRMIFAMSSRNLRFEDFTVREKAGGWGMWVNDCDNVRVSRVCMQCDPGYPNADGVHINCSADVVVSDCALHTGMILLSSGPTVTPCKAFAFAKGLLSRAVYFLPNARRCLLAGETIMKSGTACFPI